MSEPIKPNTKADVTVITERKVACHGPAHSGHPRVYLTMVDDEKGKPQDVVCPYCSRVYVYSESALSSHTTDH